MDNIIWKKFYDHIAFFQSHVHLPTLLSNLHRRGLLTNEQSEQILAKQSLGQTKFLFDLLSDHVEAEIMCDALKETNPEVLEKIGVESKTDESASSHDEETNLILKSYQAILEVSTEPHQHPENNFLGESESKHLAFM